MFKSFIKILLIFTTFIYAFSEQIFTITQRESIMQNVVTNDDLPLYITPSEAVTGNVEVSCKGLRMTDYTIQDETVVLTIPAGTVAGTKLEMNCKFPASFSNREISFLQGELPSGFVADITILFVNKFAFTFTEKEYNYLEKNGKLPIQVYSTQGVTDDIIIEDGTFYLKCPDSNIQLNNCDKISKISAKKSQNISCEVNEEIKKNIACQLNIAEGKTIDGVVPWVQTVYISFKKPEEEIPSNSTENPSNSTNVTDSSSEGEKLRFSIRILFLFFLFF